MEIIVFNLRKGRLETIQMNFSHDNTTWFDGPDDSGDIRMITDFYDDLLVTFIGRDYPLILPEVSRAAAGFSQKEVKKLLQQAMMQEG